MKFKQRDVVVLKKSPEAPYIVEVIDFTKYFEPYNRYFIKPLNQWMNADEIELEQVFNSPLYKALS